MKNLFLAITVIFLTILNLEGCDSKKSGGIRFYEKNWQAVLDNAKTTHKYIFLDIYATWCGPCKMLKKETFSDSMVAAFFNENFINASFDGESGDGPMLAERYHINAYPSLFILDENGQVVNSTQGFHTAPGLLSFANQVLKK